MTLAERLVEAEAAYHELLTGKAMVELRDQNGELIKYQAANARQLATYIAELKRQLSTDTRPNAPMEFWGRGC